MTKDSPSPFFIVGCARSGNTLLRTILHSHPDVAIPVESLFMIDYLRVRNEVAIDTIHKLLLAEFEFKEWQLDITQTELEPFNTVEDTLNFLHERYASSLNKSIWGQKTPRFVRYGNLLKEVYPNARFIHIIRDPRAVANSLRESNVHSSNYYYGAKRWALDVAKGIKLKAKYPNDVLEIFYEDLVSQPEVTMKSVTDFLKLSFTSTMFDERMEASKDYSDYFAKIHQNLSQGISTDRIFAWRNALTSDQIELIEHICSPLMTELGYEMEHPQPTLDDKLVQHYKLDRMIRGIWMQVMQYFNGRTYHLFYSIWRKLRLGILIKDFKAINY